MMSASKFSAKWLVWTLVAGAALTAPSWAQRVGVPIDWSHRHVVYSGGLTQTNVAKAAHDPRLVNALLQRNQLRVIGQGKPTRPSPLRVDWAVALGAGNVASGMSPAKYTFDATAAADCTNDYVAYGLNVAGVTGGQANLIAFNNLYSGASGGLCGTTPSIRWAYNGSTAAGSVLTSVGLSLDGTKVAYIESAAGSAIFHVLQWKAGEGASVTTAAAPSITPSVATPCVSTSSCLWSVTYAAAASNTRSSPWVDYDFDVAFLGGNDGKIYRINCVFLCAVNAQPTATQIFDLAARTAGTGGAAPVPGPIVLDSSSGNLFVGDSLGQLWSIKKDGSSFSGPIMVGGGGCTVAHPAGRTGTGADCTGSGQAFGVVDGVLLDVSNSGHVLAVSGNDGTTNAANCPTTSVGAGSTKCSATVIQTSETLTSTVRVHVGQGSAGIFSNPVPSDLRDAALDNNYFTSPSTGFLYMCGTQVANTKPTLYRIGFNASAVLNSTVDQSSPGTARSLQLVNANGSPCSPLIEFFNSTTAKDRIFTGLETQTTNSAIMLDITSGFPGSITASASEPNGTSGMVVDNNSSQPQAASIYFSTLGGATFTATCPSPGRCAVKLTQSGLQ